GADRVSPRQGRHGPADAGAEAGGLAARDAVPGGEAAAIPGGLRSTEMSTKSSCGCSRRDFLTRGLYGIGVGATLPLVLSRTSAALTGPALGGTSNGAPPGR